ncbi:MAG: hypothetical protein HQ506_03565 [Candidatus Marinimicrobia bacterium]|nr:hypothetical protein [Candidatus Neomarinimicrobiota bacterium]
MSEMMRSTVIFAVLGLASTIMAQSDQHLPMLNADEQGRIQAGEIVIREIETEQEKGQAVETMGLMSVSGEILVRLLTDYESYPEFMSAVEKIEIVEKAGEQTTLNYILRPMLGLTKKYRIKIAPVQLDEKVWKIEWHLVTWPGLGEMETIGDTQGYWLIIEESPTRSFVQYFVYSDPGYVPFGLGSIVDALGKSSIEEVFMETRTHAGKIAGKD